MATEEEIVQETEQTESQPAPPSKREITLPCDDLILVVDDLRSARKLLKSLLNKVGFSNVVTAENGMNALTVVQEKRPAIIISDWNMPEICGIELLKTLRYEYGMGDIPFLMITSNNEAQEVVKAVKMGVSDFMLKPFNKELLRDKVIELLNQAPNHAT